MTESNNIKSTKGNQLTTFDFTLNLGIIKFTKEPRFRKEADTLFFEPHTFSIEHITDKAPRKVATFTTSYNDESFDLYHYQDQFYLKLCEDFTESIPDTADCFIDQDIKGQLHHTFDKIGLYTTYASNHFRYADMKFTKIVKSDPYKYLFFQVYDKGESAEKALLDLNERLNSFTIFGSDLYQKTGEPMIYCHHNDTFNNIFSPQSPTNVHLASTSFYPELVTRDDKYSSTRSYNYMGNSLIPRFFIQPLTALDSIISAMEEEYQWLVNHNNAYDINLNTYKKDVKHSKLFLDDARKYKLGNTIVQVLVPEVFSQPQPVLSIEDRLTYRRLSLSYDKLANASTLNIANKRNNLQNSGYKEFVSFYTSLLESKGLPPILGEDDYISIRGFYDMSYL